MSRGHKETRVLSGKDGRPSALQHKESYDDTFVPDSQELAKLKEIDPTIVEWIKKRTEIEQEGRLDFNSRRMTVLEKSSLRTFLVDVYTITCSLIIILCSMALTYYFIVNHLTIEGTVFGGITVVIAAKAFLDFRKPPVKK